MKRYKPIWIIGLGLLVFIVGLSGVVQSAENLFASGSDYGEPGMEDLGFVPMSMPQPEDEVQGEAPAIIETPLEPDLAAQFTAEAEDEAQSFLDRPTPIPTPTVVPIAPDRIVIGEIGLDAPVIPAIMKRLKLEEDIFEQWLAPDELAVGWHYNTALLGQRGNTVLNGHHNVSGMVFKDLHLVKPGSLIELHGGELKFTYMVVNVMILPERGQEFTLRLENARWLLPSLDERITLITCWPATSNTHRLIVVARPFGARVETVTEVSQP